MGRIVVELDEELEKAFRDAVARHLGMKKGNLKIAIEEAIRMWIVYSSNQDNQKTDI